MQKQLERADNNLDKVRSVEAERVEKLLVERGAFIARLQGFFADLRNVVSGSEEKEIEAASLLRKVRKADEQARSRMVILCDAEVY